jgi:hypothetical protein
MPFGSLRSLLIPYYSTASTPFSSSMVESVGMSSLFGSALGLLEALKSSLPQLWLRVQDHKVFSISAILGLVVLYTARYLTSPFRKLPPGPRGYPIIGNLLEIENGQWLKFSKWQKKYGQFVPSDSLFAYYF